MAYYIVEGAWKGTSLDPDSRGTEPPHLIDAIDHDEARIAAQDVARLHRFYITKILHVNSVVEIPIQVQI